MIKLKIVKDQHGLPTVCNANTGEMIDGIEKVEIEFTATGVRAHVIMCIDSIGIDYPARIPTEKCDTCGGSGYCTMFNSIETCSDCNGRGVI